MNYWLRPSREFLPYTGCKPTGRVETFYQMPRTEWSCPSLGTDMAPDSPIQNGYTRTANYIAIGAGVLALVGTGLVIWGLVK